MAYTEPFDPSTPSALAPAGEGDDRIRELKRALNERFSTVFSNFPDGDPLVLTASIATEGLLSERPNPPAQAGLLYRATDTGQLFLSTGSGPSVWVELFVGSQQTGVGDLADRPNPPTAEGQLFYAEDESKMYVSRDDGAGSFEWITNSTTNVIVTHSLEETVQAAGSPYTVAFSKASGLSNPRLIGYRLRVSIPAVADSTSSWITVGEALTMDAASDEIRVSFEQLLLTDSQNIGGLLTVTAEPVAATSILIELEFLLANL